MSPCHGVRSGSNSRTDCKNSGFETSKVWQSERSRIWVLSIMNCQIHLWKLTLWCKGSTPSKEGWYRFESFWSTKLINLNGSRWLCEAGVRFSNQSSSTLGWAGCNKTTIQLYFVDSDEKVDMLAPKGAGGRNSRESSNLSIDTNGPVIEESF